MSTAAGALARPARVSFGPWMWGARTDLAVFGGSALAALAVVAAGHATGLSDAPMPPWMWLVLVVGVDVSHVWSTLFRTYLDGAELRRRPALYTALPLACWAAGALLYLGGRGAFWRALAYLAVFHFIRQQAGWVAIYRARAGEKGTLDRVLDDATVYAAALWPLLVWHTRIPRRFHWFVDGDFAPLALPAPLVTAAGALYAAILASFALRQAHLFATERRVHAGKLLVVSTTALLWWLGIVATDSDVDFTATNVLTHGVPYMALLWAYAKPRQREAPAALGSRIVAVGAWAFVATLVVIAFVEEGVWDRLVWHEHDAVFGAGGSDLGALGEALIVPLLAVPQATHYVLDAVLWRRRDTGRAQASAMGFASGPART